MSVSLLAYAITMFVLGHMLFGVGEALNHGAWHWLKPSELPRFMREGRAVHMLHHKSPGKMDHILIPAWGHLALLRGIVVISLIANSATTLGFMVFMSLSWADMVVAYIVLCTASAAGMGSYMAFYGYVHRNTHRKWEPTHWLYAKRHMLHHEKGFWNESWGMPILPIYGWAMWLRPVVLWGIRVWKRLEDARNNQPEADEMM